MNWKFDNAADKFAIDIGAYIVSRGILFNDITEITLMVKVNEEDADVDAVANRTLGTGIVKVVGATEADASLTVQFDQADFGATKLEAGKYYYLCLGIKTLAMSKFLEIDLDDNRLYITPDAIHD